MNEACYAQRSNLIIGLLEPSQKEASISGEKEREGMAGPSYLKVMSFMNDAESNCLVVSLPLHFLHSL